MVDVGFYKVLLTALAHYMSHTDMGHLDLHIDEMTTYYRVAVCYIYDYTIWLQ
jgi:hypothetical protein